MKKGRAFIFLGLFIFVVVAFSSSINFVSAGDCSYYEDPNSVCSVTDDGTQCVVVYATNGINYCDWGSIRTEFKPYIGDCSCKYQDKNVCNVQIQDFEPTGCVVSYMKELGIDATCGLGGIQTESFCDPITPILVTLTADPSSVVLGTASILKWSSPPDTVSCTSTPYPGFQLFGRLNGMNAFSTVVPSNLGDNVYKINCVDSNNGIGSASVIVKTVPGPIVSLVADKISVLSGQQATLSWTSSNTGSCTGTNFSTSNLLNNSIGVKVFPTVDTTYTIKCTNSVNGSLGGLNEAVSFVTVSIATPVFPDLITSPVTPTTADSGVAQNYSATITNTGDSSTGSSFSYYLAEAQDENNDGSISSTEANNAQNYLPDGTMLTLAAGASDIATYSNLAFGYAEKPWLRFCADKKSPRDAGIIAESNKITPTFPDSGPVPPGTGEMNNCGPWTAIVIPSITITIASDPNPIYVSLDKTVSTNVNIKSTGIFGEIVLSTPASTGSNTNPSLSSYRVLGNGDVTLFLTGYSTSRDGTITVHAAGSDSTGKTIYSEVQTDVKIIKLDLSSDTISVVLPKDGTSKEINLSTVLSSIKTGTVSYVFKSGSLGISNTKQGSDSGISFKIEAPGVAVNTPQNPYYTIIAEAKGTSIDGVTPISSNPVTIQVTVTDVSKPELVASSVTPLEVKYGTNINFKATITNVGNKPTGVDFYYLFQKAVRLDKNNEGVNVVNITPAGLMKALTEFDNKRFFDTATSPLILFNPTEKPYLRVCADADSRGPSSTGSTGVVSEIREDNNCGPWTRINVLAPDLVTGAVSPSVVTINKSTSFKADITNRGTYSTENSFYYIFQKTLDTNKDGKISKTEGNNASIIDKTNDRGTMSKLDKNKTSTATSPTTKFTTLGKYYVRACADKSSAMSTGYIKESDEEHNCTSPWTEVIVQSAPTPDLVISGLTSNPVSPVVNQPATYSAILLNQGGAQAGGMIKNIFQYDDDANHNAVSKTQTVTPSSPIVLNPHKNIIIEDTYTFKTAGFKKYVRACADKSSAIDGVGIVDEIVFDPTNQDRPEDSPNEDKNCGVWTKITVISPTQPDLTVGAITPTSIIDGQKSIFTSKITNIGGVSTNSSFNNVMQIASDANGKDAQTPILTTESPMRALSGSNDSANASGSYTSNLGQNGEIFVRFCADNDASLQKSTVAESSEDNCGPWTTITVTKPEEQKADLTASPVDNSDLTETDKSRTYKATITNSGATSTGISFPYFFQKSTKQNGNGQIIDLISSTMISLAPTIGATATSPLLSFSLGETPSIRVCANKTNSSIFGPISEISTDNNCGDWVNLDVVNKQANVISPTLTANPTSINKGDFSTLTWDSNDKNADSCKSADFDTKDTTSGSERVFPTVDTTYTITCLYPDYSSPSNVAKVTIKVNGDKNPGYKED